MDLWNYRVWKPARLCSTEVRHKTLVDSPLTMHRRRWSSRMQGIQIRQAWPQTMAMAARGTLSIILIRVLRGVQQGLGQEAVVWARARPRGRLGSQDKTCIVTCSTNTIRRKEPWHRTALVIFQLGLLEGWQEAHKRQSPQATTAEEIQAAALRRTTNRNIWCTWKGPWRSRNQQCKRWNN